MPEQLQQIIPYIIGAMFVVAAGLFAVALYFFRRGRRDRYWRWRRDASQAGWQLFILSLTITFVASAICLFSGFAGAVFDYSAEATATAELTNAPSEVPSVTPLVITATVVPTSEVAIATVASTEAATATDVSLDDTVEPSPTRVRMTASPTIATTQPPSVTPTATPTIYAVITIEPQTSSFPLPGDVQVDILGVSDSVTDTMPADGYEGVAADAARIYFGMAYTAMAQGAPWERALYYGEDLIQGGGYTWSGESEGQDIFFFGNAAGYIAGSYKIIITSGDRLLASIEFDVE